MSAINTLSFEEKSLLFAKLSQIAYYNVDIAKGKAKKLGFTIVKFYDKEGAQAYQFTNKTDLVIACRGTEPTQFADIKADLNALPVISETISRVHKGFKDQVDDLWPKIETDINKKRNLNKTFWVCGHSLGAAMATIITSRARHHIDLNNPLELYTYGSPRVGWPGYVKDVGVEHHRWKNNNDIVTTVPLRIMGFRHHGTEHYLNAYGQYRHPTTWQRIKDKFRGYWFGLKQGKIDSFSDHSITEYIKHISALK